MAGELAKAAATGAASGAASEAASKGVQKATSKPDYFVVMVSGKIGGEERAFQSQGWAKSEDEARENALQAVKAHNPSAENVKVEKVTKHG